MTHKDALTLVRTWLSSRPALDKYIDVTDTHALVHMIEQEFSGLREELRVAEDEIVRLHQEVAQLNIRHNSDRREAAN